MKNMLYFTRPNEIGLRDQFRTITLSLWDGELVGSEGVFSADERAECIAFLKEKYSQIKRVG